MEPNITVNSEDFFADDVYNDGDIPHKDLEPAEPLPEYTRPRKDGPGGD